MKLLPKVLFRWPLSYCCQQKSQMGAVLFLFFWPMNGWMGAVLFSFFWPMDGWMQFFFSLFFGPWMDGCSSGETSTSSRDISGSSLAQRSCIVSTLQSESGKWKYNKWGQLLLKIHTFLTPEFSYRVRALAKLAHLQGWMLKATQRYWGHRPLKLILMFNYQVFTDPRKFLPETLWIFPSLMFQLSWNDLNIDISSMAAALVDWFLFTAQPLISSPPLLSGCALVISTVTRALLSTAMTADSCTCSHVHLLLPLIFQTIFQYYPSVVFVNVGIFNGLPLQ